MESFDISKVLPLLRSFGISPERLGPENLQRLQQLTDPITDMSQITPELAREILDIVGVRTRSRPGVPMIKVGRNDLCPCGTGKKYKKCCLVANAV
jgi:uncharacterized protein YecA (UPF0149 family)